MFVKKNFIRTIQVDNIGIFCSYDLSESLQEYAKREFLHKTFDEFLIVEVLRVVRRGHLQLVSSNLSGTATIDVIFEVLAMKLFYDEIVTGLHVFKTDPTIIFHDSKKFITGGIKKTGIAKVVQVGNSIPIRIRSSEYAPNQNHIAVRGSILTCDTSFYVFKLTDALSKKDIDSLSANIRNCIQELEKREAHIAKSREAHDALWIMEGMFYSYNYVLPNIEAEIKGSNHAWHGPTGLPVDSAVNLLDFLREGKFKDMHKFYWSRPLELFRSSPLVSKTSDPPEKGVVVSQPAVVVFATFLESVFYWLKAIRELAEEFDTKEKIMNQRNLWAAIRKQQLEVPKK